MNWEQGGTWESLAVAEVCPKSSPSAHTLAVPFQSLGRATHLCPEEERSGEAVGFCFHPSLTGRLEPPIGRTFCLQGHLELSDGEGLTWCFLSVTPLLPLQT